LRPGWLDGRSGRERPGGGTPKEEDERHLPRVVSFTRPGGGQRLITLLDRVDDEAYRAAVGPAVRPVERALGPGVTGNRVADPVVVRLEDWRRARRRHGMLAEALRGRAERRGGLLVAADVRDCYGSISPGAVGEALVSLGAYPSVVGRIRRMLERLARDGAAGLPVGPEPSGALANAVLVAADRAVLRVGGRPPLRWVDDVLAAAPDERGAGRIVEALSEALGRLGLSLNAAKTRVFEPVPGSVAGVGGSGSGIPPGPPTPLRSAGPAGEAPR
jgi:hypothetical protein